MKKALVTGGLGFIGSHLVDLLLSKEINVWVIDNCISNAVGIDYILNRAYYSKSIDEEDWQDHKFDVVFHLASFVGPVSVLNYAGEMGAGILNDTIKLRNYCIENDALLIDISTSEIYGASGVFSENSHKVYPADYQIRTEYGAGKMLAEMSITNKAKVDNRLKYHIIRPFNVSGPRQKPDGGFVLPRFVIAALTDQELTIYGNGKQERAFTDVRDVCDAIFKIASSEHKNEIWNVGNPINRMSINHLAAIVLSNVGNKYPDKKINIKHINPKEIHGKTFSEVESKIPDATKAFNMLKWKPKKLLVETVQDTIDFYDKKIKEGYYFNVSGG